MTRWMIAALPLALGMTVTACNSNASKSDDQRGSARGDAGPPTSQDFALNGFTGVTVVGPDDVTIARADEFSINATGPKSEIDELEVERDGDVLMIGRKKSGFSFGDRNHAGVKIAITMPKLTRVRLTGSGNVDAELVDGENAELAVTGSSDIKVAKLTAKRADLSISGSGDIEIGGGIVNAGDYSVTGSGNIKADDLGASSLDISITGSGDVNARASGAAKVSILGSGDATVRGGAKCTTRALGSGTATCE